MPKLSSSEATELRRAVEAEFESKRAAAEAHQRFGSVAVFSHLEESAARHIATLCETLRLAEENAPVLAPTTATNPSSLIEALEAAADREQRTAAIYSRIMEHTRDDDLKNVLRPLWQSVSHLHLTAIADQLSIEQHRG